MDDRAIDAMLAEADRKLPALQACSRDVRPRIVVGRGSCGLGDRYHRAVQLVVRQTQLREWVVDAERRCAAQGRSVSAIAEAQRNALLQAQLEKEEQMMEQIEARRREKQLEKKWVRDQMEQQLQQKRQDRADAEELARWQRELLRQQRSVEEQEADEQRAVEAYNASLLQDISAMEEQDRHDSLCRLHESIQRGRQWARQHREETIALRQAAAKAASERCRKAEEKQHAEKQREINALRKLALQQRQEHRYRLQEVNFRVEEAVAHSREVSKSVPNADAIMQRQTETLEGKRRRLKEQRERQKIRRSVSSFM